jgi:hypothetical protein
LLVVVTVGAASAAVSAAVSADRRHLVSLRAGDGGQWMTGSEVMALVRTGTHFFDATSTPELVQRKGGAPTSRWAYPPPSHAPEVEGYLAQIDMQRPQADLTAFTSFYTRFHSVRGRGRPRLFLLRLTDV